MEDVPNLGETWFALSKVDFDEFVVGADDCQVHDNLVAVDPSQLAKFCPSKWKIIIELVHQALYFCKDRKILFEGAKLLVALLELELKHLANSDANRAADSETTLERMTKKVNRNFFALVFEFLFCLDIRLITFFGLHCAGFFRCQKNWPSNTNSEECVGVFHREIS